MLSLPCELDREVAAVVTVLEPLLAFDIASSPDNDGSWSPALLLLLGNRPSLLDDVMVVS